MGDVAESSFDLEEACGQVKDVHIRTSAKNQDFDRFRIHESYLVRPFRFRFRFFPTG